MNGPINSDDILISIGALFDSDRWWIYKGELVREFEDKFSRFHGCASGVSTCNGTVPFEIVLRGLGIGPGDKVILPAYDFYSLPKSISNVGAIPVFADVCETNPTIAPIEIEDLLATGAKAVVVAHICGAVAEVDTIAEICRGSGVYLIEDCAQAAGARYAGRPVGSFGIAGLFSFGGIKLLTSGQGGMITTSDEELYEKCYAMTNRGIDSTGKMNSFGIVGDNYQMSELSAATLIPQLDLLEKLSSRREDIMSLLDTSISAIEGIVPVSHFDRADRRAQMRYCFYYQYAEEDEYALDSLVNRAMKGGIPLQRLHKCVWNDERLAGMYKDQRKYPNSARAEASLIGIHHSDILKGFEYWKDALNSCVYDPEKR